MSPHLCSSLKLRHSEKKYEIHHIKKCKPYPNLQLAAEMIVYATSHWMNTHEANAIFNQVLSQESLKSFLKKGLGFSTNLGILIDNGGTPFLCHTKKLVATVRVEPRFGNSICWQCFPEAVLRTSGRVFNRKYFWAKYKDYIWIPANVPFISGQGVNSEVMYLGVRHWGSRSPVLTTRLWSFHRQKNRRYPRVIHIVSPNNAPRSCIYSDTISVWHDSTPGARPFFCTMSTIAKNKFWKIDPKTSYPLAVDPSQIAQQSEGPWPHESFFVFCLP